jgi:energy-coupling factor transport system permease protein
LNPLTKAVVASLTTLAALVLGGYVGPAALLAALVIPGASVARVLRRVLTASAALTLPLAVAVGLVSVFTRPGATVLFRLGPFDATLEGLDFAGQVVVRLFVMAAALSLFGLTTAPRAFINDLERRGVSPRIAFALGSVLEAVPLMVDRARSVADAQRARGLDTEGRLLRRAAAVVPLVGPVVVGSLHEVEARSLALDARAFGRPGPRHLLWAPVDAPAERLARWLLIAGFAALVAGSVTGILPRLP